MLRMHPELHPYLDELAVRCGCLANTVRRRLAKPSVSVRDVAGNIAKSIGWYEKVKNWKRCQSKQAR